MCMERGDLWREVTGMEMNDNEDLIGLFDKRIKYLFGGNI